ncbi:MAG: mechanosensitive ion channel family protein [Phycisphaerae bacterium]|nr:mechanosensitive ion channel family protein [Phycisphaerae bacterium]
MPRPYLCLRGLAVAVFLCLQIGTNGSVAAAEQGEAAHRAVTTADPTVPVDQLKLMLKPLTADELAVEADAWLGLLKAKVQEISDSELGVRRKRAEIAKVEEAVAVAEEEKEEIPQSNPARDAQHQEKKAAEAKATAEAEEKARTALVEQIGTLRDQRTALLDRLEVVLKEFEAKGGDAATYRKYMTAVSGVSVDVTDASATWVTVKGWLTSEAGGLRWLKNIALFLVTLLAFWILAAIVGKVVQKALDVSKRLTALLRDFLVRGVRRAILVVGFIMALGALEINIGPIMAVIGAAGFVVAFALQGTLSNFASGILILFYRPFDVGDAIDVAGVSGTVKSMNLLSTQINTFDNKMVVVPNNSIWGNVITNITGSDIRRVDMVFGIGYADDMAKAQSIMESILSSHPHVLAEPPPVVKLHELGESSVNFICRPWVKTADYWGVYWDVTRGVKEQFDAQGVSIPFPQRDVHIFNAAPST